MAEHRLAIIGLGRIARTEHVPAVLASPDFRLVAVVCPRGGADIGVPIFPSVPALLTETGLGLDAVAICTPPDVRHAIALQCLKAGLHLLLEKPAASTLGEAADIARHSQIARKTAFAAWHARHQIAVRDAASILAREGLASLHVIWREDPQKWHPGQDWIWQPKGFGVFDAGLNALSILTCLVPDPLLVHAAQFSLPQGGQQPIEARLELAGAGIAQPMTAEFDWRSGQTEQRTVTIRTAKGTDLLIRDGGFPLILNGTALCQQPVPGEYPELYAHFAQLIAQGCSDMDLEPLRIAADAYLIARRKFSR